MVNYITVEKTIMKKLPSTKTLPLDVGVIYFVGIGGIGMSGIAEILHNLGYKVQGSDASLNANVTRLRDLGIDVKIGQKAENIVDVDVVVKSTAIKDDNPEIVAAREKRIPVVKRAEMLAELMRLKTCVAVAGTHGKTTTTSLVTAMFESARLNPTVINGGIINAYGTNARLGTGEWLVAEADESDGTFLKLPATIGVITNIEAEHLDHYGSFDDIKDAFAAFVNNLPFYGFCVMCIDHDEVEALYKQVVDRRIVTYGIEKEADVRAKNIRCNVDGAIFDVEIAGPLQGGKRVLKDMQLPMPGTHNILNALAAISIALELEFDDETILHGFNEFQGVKRRFTKTGEVDGITIIDDYGHHPTEITATLNTARDVLSQLGKGKLVAVFQPHRYSRVHDLYDEFCMCFSEADSVIVTPIYEAGERPIEGITQNSIVDGIKSLSKNTVYAIADDAELVSKVNEISSDGDFVVCMGAGTISLWANALPQQLADIRKKAG